MKNKLFLFLATVFSSFCFSQITFDKGYFINSNNQTIECLIKNVDWNNNPTTFDYKLSETGETKIGSINFIKEFGVYNFSKYVKVTVDIDRSPTKIELLGNTKAPDLKEETLFLKVLINGEANLYFYEDKNLKRFFFNTGESPIEQLIYKNYKVSDRKVASNNEFRMQLWRNLKSDKFIMSDFKYINYNEKELIKIFVKYNGEQSKSITNFESKKNKSNFNLSLKSGLRNNKLEISRPPSDAYDIGNQISIPFALELESVFTFNRNKWAIIVESSFQSYISQIITDVPSSNRDLTIEADYKSLEIAFGVRHYMYLNEKSRIFINGFYVLDFPLDSRLVTTRGSTIFTNSEFEKAANSALGIGFIYNSKYSIELRQYLTRRNTREDWYTKYNSISLVFGYTLF